MPDDDHSTTDHSTTDLIEADRELIADYGERIGVVVPHDGRLTKVDAIDLLPTRNW